MFPPHQGSWKYDNTHEEASRITSTRAPAPQHGAMQNVMALRACPQSAAAVSIGDGCFPSLAGFQLAFPQQLALNSSFQLHKVLVIAKTRRRDLGDGVLSHAQVRCCLSSHPLNRFVFFPVPECSSSRRGRVVSCRCRSRMRDGRNAVLRATREFVYERGILLLRGLALVGTVVLLGFLTLYGQAKTQAHIEKHILPPLASVVGAALGRNVSFGRVQGVSPLGLTLESCSVGPHDEEFSCGELPTVEIRVRPLASIHRRQIVLDAVLMQPNLLVCQKKDWTWLGIPAPSDRSFHRSSSEEGIDIRKKTRRLSRERMALKLARVRDEAARRWAHSGYLLRSEEVPLNEAGNGHDDIIDGSLKPGTLGDSSSRQRMQQFDRDWYTAIKGAEEESYRSYGEDISASDKLSLGRSLTDCRTWLDEHFVKPVRLFKQWSAKPSIKIAEGQRRNLDNSAAAARASFERIDRDIASINSRGRDQREDSKLTEQLQDQKAISTSKSHPGGVVTDDKGLKTSHEMSDNLLETLVNSQSSEVYQAEDSETKKLGEEKVRVPANKAEHTNNEDGNCRQMNVSVLSEEILSQDWGDHVMTNKSDEEQSTSLNMSNLAALDHRFTGSKHACNDRLSEETAINAIVHDDARSEFTDATSEQKYKRVQCIIQNGGGDDHAITKIMHPSDNELESGRSSPPLEYKGSVMRLPDLEKDNLGRRITSDQRSLPQLASLSSHKSGLRETRPPEGILKWLRSFSSDTYVKKHESKVFEDAPGYKQTSEPGFMSKARDIAGNLVAQAKSNLEAAPLQKWVPLTLDSVYFRGGTLMLLAYGDHEPRVMESINGYVKLGNKYEQVDVHVIGRLREWRTAAHTRDGGRLLVKVSADIWQQKWHVKLKGNNLFAPVLERLLEIPLDWSNGRATGELNIWASKGDLFPKLSGKLNVSKLDFQIWEAPSAFKDVSGTLFFQGHRLFLHNTSGFFGAVPLHVSGDMDLNPDSGEYRLVCQVPNVEANALMKTLKARPPLFPLAGAIKAAVYCRGPLEVPVFAGSADISKVTVGIGLDEVCTAATEAIKQYEDRGAVAAFDRVPFSNASANFTFDTDNCIADLYGIRATLVNGGEIRGAGNMWICPEGEMDPTAVNVDLSGQVFFDSVVQNYLPASFKPSPVKLDYVHGEAKIHGSLLQPVFDIKWNAPEAKGTFSGARGDINISHEAIAINSTAFTFDLSAKIHTSYPPLLSRREHRSMDVRPLPPDIEGLEVDLRMRGFDFLGLASPSSPGTPAASEGFHTKVTGRAKFQGRVVKLEEDLEVVVVKGRSNENTSTLKDARQHKASGVTGEILLSGLKLNQFLVAPHLSGSMDIFPSRFKLSAIGRADEQLKIEFVGNLKPDRLDQRSMFNTPVETGKTTMFLSLERGQLRTIMDYQPGHSAKLEVRNLQLDELELASLRGIVQKAEMQLNFQKRRGHGSLSVRRPRFSGVHGESLDLSCRWSGDVITIEKSVLEQASSQYELQGEYVLPGPRDRLLTEKERGDGTWKTAMAGQLGSFITSLGRWRLRLEVPHAEVADMLPVARLLLRSSDPAVVSRSKELFMHGMQHVGFCTESLKQQLEYVRNSKALPALEEGSPESMPLPGLAELRGRWHGTFDASGGGNGDTSSDFDFRGEEWEWGEYKTQRVVTVGSYNNNDGLQLDKIFIQKDSATLHADGTLLGPKSNLHFAVLNFPIGLVPPLLHAIQSSTLQPVPYQTTWGPITSIKGILYMEGDLRGPLVQPQCDVQVRLLDGAVGGVDLGRAEVVASITSSNRLNFNANFEPVVRSGHVHVRGSLPLEARGLDAIEDDETHKENFNMKRSRGWNRSKSKLNEETDVEGKKIVRDRLGDEGWEVHLAESLKGLDWDFSDKGAVQVDATVKDGGMTLITALSPHLRWLQGSADMTLQVRGTADQPTVDGVAAFHKVSISSPVLPRPLSNFGGTIRVLNNQLCVEGLDGRVGRKGRLQVKGKLPLRASESSKGDNIELKADLLEVRAKNMFSGQVDSQMRFTGSMLEPEVSGMIKLSRGEAYLPHEKGANSAASTLASSLKGMAAGGKITHFHSNEAASLPDHLRETQAGTEDKVEEKREQRRSSVAIQLRNLKLYLGPELRVVYPLILNFAVSGEVELNGLADPQCIKPKGTLTFENGDVNLVATQVRLNRDHPNRARFEPEQGLDPSLDLALVGADWQLKIQGRARNWQDNLVLTSTRSGEPDALTRSEAARVFESQLADSLLEGDGQLAFKKLAAATVETLMPKIEGKGEFGQARWRLVSAPQIPNLLSLDPTTDPFKSLANLSFGTEVEVQLGKRLQASVVRQLKESEMATQWTLLYQLNNKLRILFSSIPSVDNRLLFEYSATSQN